MRSPAARLNPGASRDTPSGLPIKLSRNRLKLSDLPQGSTAYRPAGLEPGALGLHCKGPPDESDLTLTGKSFSPLFKVKDADEGLYSGASVFPSAGQVRTAFQREMRPALAHCFAKWTISFFAGVSPVVLSSQSLKPLSGLGMQAGALRQVFKFVGPPTDSFAEDVIVLRKGRVESWVSGHFGAELLQTPDQWPLGSNRRTTPATPVGTSRVCRRKMRMTFGATTGMATCRPTRQPWRGGHNSTPRSSTA